MSFKELVGTITLVAVISVPVLASSGALVPIDPKNFDEPTEVLSQKYHIAEFLRFQKSIALQARFHELMVQILFFTPCQPPLVLPTPEIEPSEKTDFRLDIVEVCLSREFSDWVANTSDPNVAQSSLRESWSIESPTPQSSDSPTFQKMCALTEEAEVERFVLLYIDALPKDHPAKRGHSSSWLPFTGKQLTVFRKFLKVLRKTDQLDDDVDGLFDFSDVIPDWGYLVASFADRTSGATKENQKLQKAQRTSHALTTLSSSSTVAQAQSQELQDILERMEDESRTECEQAERTRSLKVLGFVRDALKFRGFEVTPLYQIANPLATITVLQAAFSTCTPVVGDLVRFLAKKLSRKQTKGLEWEKSLEGRLISRKIEAERPSLLRRTVSCSTVVIKSGSLAYSQLATAGLGNAIVGLSIAAIDAYNEQDKASVNHDEIHALIEAILQTYSAELPKITSPILLATLSEIQQDKMKPSNELMLAARHQLIEKLMLADIALAKFVLLSRLVEERLVGDDSLLRALCDTYEVDANDLIESTTLAEKLGCLDHAAHARLSRALRIP